MPSPNIPTLDSAIVYPGTVLFEGTNVSEGRGTTRPFELVGAPWVAAERFAAALNRPRAARRPFPAGGVRADIPQAREDQLRRLPDPRDRSRGVPPGRSRRRADRRVSRRANPSAFAWRQPPYEYEHEKLPIDILAGSADLREQIEAGIGAREIARSWETGGGRSRRCGERFLLY